MTGEGTPAPQPYKHYTTLAWAFLVAIASSLTAVLAIAIWFPDGINADMMKDARLFGWLSLAGLVGELVVLVAASRLAGWRARDYLGLVMPSRPQVVFSVAIIVILVAGLDSITWLLGREVVTPFQAEVYNSARATGSWLPLLLAVVIGAPVGEELMFRGFLFRGWAQSPRQVWPAIIVISALWAALHSQYDWFGVGQIFIIGLVLGWVRWSTGSTLLTILLHGLIDAWATVQTIVVMEFLR